MFQTDLEGVLKRGILLCLISIGFCTANTHMTMELDSVDDQYIGCREEMLKKVIEPGGLLDTELKADRDYLEAWSNGKTCRKPVPGAGVEQNIALAVFTSDFNFYDKFSVTSKILGTNVDIYKTKFPYKSLHFLLTDVFRLLNKTENCYEGISGAHSNFASTEINSVVRLGHYIWGSPFMERFCTTEYRVRSCLAVDVTDYACLGDIDVIIPPYEMFNVTNVEVVDDDNAKVIRKVIVSLTAIGTRHNHDCSYLKKTPTAPTSTGTCVLPATWGLLVLLALSLCLP